MAVAPTAPEPPPLIPLPPDKEAQIRASTLLIERRYGGLDPTMGVAGTGVVIAGSAQDDSNSNLIVTNEHVVFHNVQDENTGLQLADVNAPGSDKPKPPEISIYTGDHQLIGTAEIVARGYHLEGTPARREENDQAVLRITHFDTPEMAKMYSHLGIPLAKEQSAQRMGFRLPDRTTIKQGNSGGPAVDTNGDLIGINSGIEDHDGQGLLVGASSISPMSNNRILAVLGDAGQGIRYIFPNANGVDRNPVRAEVFGYRGGDLYRFGAEMYEYPHAPFNASYMPPITQAFVAAADETALAPHAKSEVLPSFLDKKYSGKIEDTDPSHLLRLGHDNGSQQTYVSYASNNSEHGRQTILYFDDPNQRIIPWLQRQKAADPSGIFARLLGDNKDDLAKLYSTLNSVAKTGQAPIVTASATPPAAAPVTTPPPATAHPSPPPAHATTPPPSASATTPPQQPPKPSATAHPPHVPTKTAAPPKPAHQPHQGTHIAGATPHHGPHKGALKPAAETHDASTNFLNDIEYNLHHPETKVDKDAAYVTAENNIAHRHEDNDPDYKAARQKQADPHTTNLNALKSDPAATQLAQGAKAAPKPTHPAV